MDHRAEVSSSFGRHCAGNIPDTECVAFPRWYREYSAEVCSWGDRQRIVVQTQSQIVYFDPVEAGSAMKISSAQSCSKILGINPPIVSHTACHNRHGVEGTL